MEVSPVLGSFLQGDDGPNLTIVDQLLEADLRASNEIIPGVSVLVEDLEVERQRVVGITELGERNVDEAPLGI